MKPRTQFEAVRDGTFDAVDGAIRNATSCPTEYFFWSVQEGIRLALDSCITPDLIREAIADGIYRAMLEIGGKS